MGFLARDADGAVFFLGDWEDGYSVQGRSVLDVTGFGVEASCGKKRAWLSAKGLVQHIEWSKLTSVPWAGQTAVGGQDAIDERSAVVGTLGADGLDLATSIDKQDLCTEALDFDLLLEAGLQVERGDAAELVLLGHGSGGSGEFPGCKNGVT